MDLEDQRRFSFPMLRLDDQGAYLQCDRCHWAHEIDAEVCR